MKSLLSSSAGLSYSESNSDFVSMVIRYLISFLVFTLIMPLKGQSLPEDPYSLSVIYKVEQQCPAELIKEIQSFITDLPTNPDINTVLTKVNETYRNDNRLPVIRLLIASRLLHQRQRISLEYQRRLANLSSSQKTLSSFFPSRSEITVKDKFTQGQTSLTQPFPFSFDYLGSIANSVLAHHNQTERLYRQWEEQTLKLKKRIYQVTLEMKKFDPIELSPWLQYKEAPAQLRTLPLEIEPL